jgi:phosphoribosyl-AMP cyclohydrolase / phosphoribosyl-ATP pyrophosphohydrolase
VSDNVFPLLVSIQGGGVAVALMTAKGFSKSREQGTLWISHPETGRILPWEGEPRFLSLEEKDSRYEAVLPAGSSSRPLEVTRSTVDVEKHEAVELDSRAEDGAFLQNLTGTIQQRHRDMPEGSYTTHLFSKGLDKIKKKTGEEAVELLLAQDKEDILYESADLIYHLLVLLEASGLTFFDVLAELEKRDS